MRLIKEQVISSYLVTQDIKLEKMDEWQDKPGATCSENTFFLHGQLEYLHYTYILFGILAILFLRLEYFLYFHPLNIKVA